METFAAREARNNFGRLLDTAQRETVTIEKKGRPVAVVLSKAAYDDLQRQLQDYRSERETAFLMRGNNDERLMQAIERHKRGDKGIVKTLEELEAMVADAD